MNQPEEDAPAPGIDGNQHLKVLDVLNNNGVPYAGLIENQAGGLFDIQSDQTPQNTAGTTAYFHNAGTLRKSCQRPPAKPEA